MMALKDKVVVITGASRGVGRALAIGFSGEGATVVATARTLRPGAGVFEGSLEETVDQIAGAGGRALAIPCDMTVEAEIRALVDRTLAEAGPIDVLINNAGISHHGPLAGLSVEEFDRVMSVNLRGPFITCKYVVPGMMERRRGNIINLTSRNAIWDSPEDLVYGPSKAALDRFSKNLAEDLKPYNIAVNALSPGLIISYMTRNWDPSNNPRGLEISPPEVVLPAALWLAQQDASFTGHVLLRNDFRKTWP
ncbi:MAG: SDR family oxidoreductase [Chloroflexi bacterium]|nr:SDR family oxidoreductase [Chloroflexota bacterium]